MSWLDRFFLKGYTAVQINGVAVPDEQILNFLAGITAADDAANERTNLSIPDAASATRGLVKLTNDFGGNADAPTVKQITGDGTGLLRVLATLEVRGFGATYAVDYLFGTATSATTANQTIATIPIIAGTGVNRLDFTLAARQGANAYTLKIETSYLDNGAGPIIMGTDTLGTVKTAGSIGAPNPNTAVSSQNVIVRVTPWTTSPVTWTVTARHTIAA